MTLQPMNTVPFDNPSKEKQYGDEEGHEYNSVSSSGLISFKFPNGHSNVPLVPTAIDVDQYVEYPLDNPSDFPCNMEEEERMFMEAVIESLKDLDFRRPQEGQLSNMGTNSPESSHKSDQESSSKAEHSGSSRTDGSCSSVTNTTRDSANEHSSPDGSVVSVASTSDTPPSFVKPGRIDEHPSRDASVSSVGATSETPPSFIKPGSIGEHPSSDVSVSSATGPTSETRSIETSACNDVSASDGDRSAKEADTVGGTRATLTVQRNPTSHVLDGLRHRWGLNFFRNS